MEQSEKIQYLANLISLVRSDNDVDSEEEKLLQKLAEGIGADPSSLEEAEKLASSPDFEASYPENNSLALQLLDDMLLLAHADNRLAFEEILLLRKLVEHLHGAIHGGSQSN
jgi:uncharacterized tellurite resistance protein B-like protein